MCLLYGDGVTKSDIVMTLCVHAKSALQILRYWHRVVRMMLSHIWINWPDLKKTCHKRSV